MGAWSFEILDDDQTSDIIDFATNLLKTQDTLATAIEKTKHKFYVNDIDEDARLWIAIAHLQWKYGTVDVEILGRVRNDIAMENGLALWKEDAQALIKRKSALNKFLLQIESVNSTPSKLPKLILFKAPFAKGDCLSIKLPDGRYTAALTLKADNSNPERGMNLIASLNYLDAAPPKLEFFKRKEWLMLSHGNWKNRKDINWYLPANFQKKSKQISVIGHIFVGWFPPKEDGFHSSWSNLGEQILLSQSSISN
jgi:hypothetical protein